MARPELYPASTIDAKFEAVHAKLEALRQELKGDIKGLDGKIEALRGEIKVWLLVLVLLVSPVITTLGSRALAAVWPVPAPASQPAR